MGDDVTDLELQPPFAAAGGASVFRRLDHVGIAVRDADRWIPYYRDVMRLPLVGDETAKEPGTRLVYFDAGNAFVQLVAPLRPDSDIHAWLGQHGEGIHHFCMAIDSLADAVQLGHDGPPMPVFRAGRRRNACFLGETPEGVRIEVTETHPSR